MLPTRTLMTARRPQATPGVDGRLMAALEHGDALGCWYPNGSVGSVAIFAVILTTFSGVLSSASHELPSSARGRELIECKSTWHFSRKAQKITQKKKISAVIVDKKTVSCIY